LLVWICPYPHRHIIRGRLRPLLLLSGLGRWSRFPSKFLCFSLSKCVLIITQQAAHIGYGLAIAGAAAALIQLLAMPTLLRVLDTARLYSLTLAAWPASFAILPFLHALAERAQSTNGSGELGVATMILLWIGIALSLGLSRLGCMAYSAHMILVKDAAPAPAALGRTNGLAQVFHTSARALAPTLVSAFFAASSVQNGALRYTWAVAMAIICIIACYGARTIQRERLIALASK
jgi:hypothetical protein